MTAYTPSLIMSCLCFSTLHSMSLLPKISAVAPGLYFSALHLLLEWCISPRADELLVTLTVSHKIKEISHRHLNSQRSCSLNQVSRAGGRWGRVQARQAWPSSVLKACIKASSDLYQSLWFATRDSNRIVQGFVLTQSPDVPVWCSKDVLPVLVKTEQNQK